MVVTVLSVANLDFGTPLSTSQKIESNPCDPYILLSDVTLKENNIPLRINAGKNVEFSTCRPSDDINRGKLFHLRDSSIYLILFKKFLKSTGVLPYPLVSILEAMTRAVRSLASARMVSNFIKILICLL